MLLILVVLSVIPASILKSVNSFSMLETLLPMTLILVTLVCQYSVAFKVILPKVTLINRSIEKLKNSLAVLHPKPKLPFIKSLLFDYFLSFSLGQIFMEFSIVTFNLTSDSSISKGLHFLGIGPF
jgi:hypothetical protein